MGKSILLDDVNQSLLFPPSLHDGLPERHLARFLVEVVSALDLRAIYASYEAKDGRGQSAYAPAMMVRVLLYGYATGVYSSRKMEAKTYDDVAFRYLSAGAHPDHDTLAEFRKRHPEALSGLFTQALLLCEKAGLVKLGHVSLDGTKIKANASKHKAMSYARMTEDVGLAKPTVRSRQQKATLFLKWLSTRCRSLAAARLRDVDDFLIFKGATGWSRKSACGYSDAPRPTAGVNCP